MNNNRREFYRLEMFGEEDILVIHSGGIERGSLIDISATGISFECNYEFEFERGETEFNLAGKTFKRKIECIRKKNLDSGKTLYAVKFYDFTEKERQILFQTLLKIEAKKRLGRGEY
ncbi:PilZ domain-containing protein [Bacillus mexicanus]|uniref:PilZ domain-containing protein n=1 Tax=Bacillus mexicanus TaxID=2834415 RepID=UPI003D1D8F74